MVDWSFTCLELLVLFYLACHKSECKCTHLNVSYEWKGECVLLPIEDMATRTSLVFHAKPVSSVAIGLAETSNPDSLVRTVWLGVSKSKSDTETAGFVVIATVKTCGYLTNTSVLHSHGTFHGDLLVFSPFWMQWDDMNVHVGKGLEPGDNTLLTYHFQSGLDVRHIFLGQLGKTLGSQVFFVDAPFASSNCVFPKVSEGAISSQTPSPLTAGSTTIALPESTGESTTVPLPTPTTSIGESTTVDLPGSTGESTTFVPPDFASESTTFGLPGTTGESTSVPLPTPTTSTGESTTVDLPGSTGESTTFVLPDFAGESTTFSQPGTTGESTSVPLPTSTGESTTAVLHGSTGDSMTIAPLASRATESHPSSASTKGLPATSPRSKRCKCKRDASRQNCSLPTDAEKHLLAAKVVKELAISPTNTSAWIRKKTSATDERVSSGVMGSAGVAMSLAPFIIVCTMDLLRLVRHLKKWHQTRHRVQELQENHLF